MWSWTFWKDCGERAIRTFAAALAAWLAGASDPLDWSTGLTLAGIATIYSALMSISAHTVTQDGASFTDITPKGRDDDFRN